MWLAETSQQPISQTTWLKVTLHCNYHAALKIQNIIGGEGWERAGSLCLSSHGARTISTESLPGLSSSWTTEISLVLFMVKINDASIQEFLSTNLAIRQFTISGASSIGLRTNLISIVRLNCENLHTKESGNLKSTLTHTHTYTQTHTQTHTQTSTV